MHVVKRGPVDLAVRCSGEDDGTPVLLVHGMGSDHTTWRKVAGALRAQGIETRDFFDSCARQPMIAVAGCVAQAEGEEIARRAKVDIVVGPQAYHNLPDLVGKAAAGALALAGLRHASPGGP